MTHEEKKIQWSQLAYSLCFVGFGLFAAIRGETEFDLGHVAGASVRIGGVLLCVIGIMLALKTVIRK